MLPKAGVICPCAPATVLSALLIFAVFAQGQSSLPPSTGSPGDPARLIGVWEGRDRSEDGMGETVEFRSGGALTISSGMMLNFQGRLVKDELVGMVESLSNVPQEVHIRATGDRLTYMASGVPQQWARVGTAPAGQPAWVGTWAFESAARPRKSTKRYESERKEVEQSMRTSMRMTITPDGKGRLRFPMNSQNGAYSVDGNKLLLQYGGRMSVTTWRLEGNTLFLLYPGGHAESRFERAP